MICIAVITFPGEEGGFTRPAKRTQAGGFSETVKDGHRCIGRGDEREQVALILGLKEAMFSSETDR